MMQSDMDMQKYSKKCERQNISDFILAFGGVSAFVATCFCDVVLRGKQNVSIFVFAIRKGGKRI